MFELWTLVLGLILLILTICYWIFRCLNYSGRNGIPFVPGLPVFGNMIEVIFRRKTIADTVSRVYNYDRDAKYIEFYDFSNFVIILRDLDIIKSVTIKNFDSFPDHKMLSDEVPDSLFKDSLFGQKGERWKDTRTVLSPSFTSSKMKIMFKLMKECVENIIVHIKTQGVTESQIFDMKDILTRYTNDVIVTSAYGVSVNSLTDTDNDFIQMGKEATNFSGSRSIRLFVLRTFPTLSKFLNIKLFNERIVNYFTNVVKKTMAVRKEKGIVRPDMLQLMMWATEKNEHLKLTDNEMTAHAFIFYFGGFDTSSLLMCYTVHEIAVHPTVQKKLQREVDETLKECDGNVTYEALHAMQYLDSVINEILRLYSPAVFVDRLCRREFELPPAKPGLKPFSVKPGVSVWIPLAAIHRDEKYFSNPNEFRPERFIDDDIDPTTFIPFGLGPRICIGNRFALMEAKLVIFELIANFNLSPCSKTVNPLKTSLSSFVTSIDGGVWLRLEPR